MKLVIVESPTKAKTIQSFFDDSFKIISSYGHIRDLPKSKLGIDVENNFKPEYVIPTKVRKKVSELKKNSKDAEEIILATDEDREGEAIAWHIINILGIKPNDEKRIVFHEITKEAILNAIKTPRKINSNLVNAQQARRILDRLVGYKLSPFLWEKIARGLSAGRVQSVTLKIIAEREREIEQFNPKEYWEIYANIITNKNDKLKASLLKINGQKIKIGDIADKNSANKIKEELEKANYSIVDIIKKPIRKNPLPPFITSTLQQEAFKKLRFSSKQTMMIAQILYEKGLITYMRTDSFNLSKQATYNAKELIEKDFGREYSISFPRVFKNKSKNSQEAHEAIRPSDPFLNPIKNDVDKIKTDKEQKLYELIWRRFIASQMQNAEFINTRIEINAELKNKYTLTSSGSIMKFDGFLRVWKHKYSEQILPNIDKSDSVRAENIETSQHFTQPPARYNEASLIKILEEYGIGRPSTYAPTISVLQNRNYIEKNEQRKFEPTEIGIKVNDILVKHFPKIVDIEFTAEMEKNLDKIANGEKKWEEIIENFYLPFEKNLEEKYKSVESQKPKAEKSNIKCEKCGSPMLIKFSRYGKFLACSAFPKCKNTKPLPDAKKSNNTRRKFGECPKCKTGEVIRIRSKKGRFFYGCSMYPKCDFVSWKKPINDRPTT